MTSRSPWGLVLWASVALTLSCTGEQQSDYSPNPQTPAPGATGTTGQTAGDIAGATANAASITVTSSVGINLSAVVGQPLAVSITGSSTHPQVLPSTIQLQATVSPQPPTMTITGQGTNNLQVSWTPTSGEANLHQSGRIVVTARSSALSNATGSQDFVWTLAPGLGGTNTGSGTGDSSGLRGFLETIRQALGGGSGGGGGGGGGSGILAGVGDFFRDVLGVITGGGAGAGGRGIFGGFGGLGSGGGSGFGGGFDDDDDDDGFGFGGGGGW